MAVSTTTAETLKSSPRATYNTASLTQRLSIDLLSALTASTLTAPVITLIDKSIILRTHTPSTLSTILLSSLRSALRHPFAFLTSAPYLLINTLYLSTYTAANFTDTFTSTLARTPPSSVSAGPQKFFCVSAVNMSLCLYKDARFARMFGAAAGTGAKKVVPKTTMALFAARDSMTMFASFNVPPVLGPILGSAAAAQILAPAGVQLASTPLHLLGLDLYNRPRDVPAVGGRDTKWSDRLRVVRRDWIGASFARMGRIIPAYGIGGVVNTNVRKKLMGSLD